MKPILLPAAFGVLLAAGWSAAPAQAAGCLKGAVVGGVAGHYVGHHGLIGAGAGCVIGHHEATKHARERAREQAREQHEGSSGDGHDTSSAGR
jgi:hypothetical protein